MRTLNRALPDERRLRAGSELLLWLFAGAALLAMPGRLPLSPGERSWRELAARMVEGHDLLSGCGGHYALLNTWLAALPGVLGGGSEIPLWLLRLPSILMAGLLLYATMASARRLWNEQTALTCGWLLAGSVGFLWFGRLAIPAVASAASVMLAFSVACREPARRGFWNYCGFYLLFFAGAWCGGLPTQLTVVAMMAPLLMNGSRWRRECRWPHLAGALVGAVVYGVPFALPAVLTAEGGFGLRLTAGLRAVGGVLQAQFQRGDWFMLYREVPLAILVSVALPYFPLIAVTALAVVRNRATEPATRRFALGTLMAVLWLLVGPAAEFGLLLLLPLLIVLTAAVLQEQDEREGRWLSGYAAAAAALAAGSLLPIWLALSALDIRLSWSTLAALPLCGAAAVALLLVDEQHPDLIGRGSLLPARLAAPLLALACLSAGMVCWALPEWARQQIAAPDEPQIQRTEWRR